LGSGDPNGPNGALGPWDLEIRVLKYIEGWNETMHAM
jgi:hypothetical protein